MKKQYEPYKKIGAWGKPGSKFQKKQASKHTRRVAKKKIEKLNKSED